MGDEPPIELGIVDNVAVAADQHIGSGHHNTGSAGNNNIAIKIFNYAWSPLTAPLSSVGRSLGRPELHQRLNSDANAAPQDWQGAVELRAIASTPLDPHQPLSSRIRSCILKKKIWLLASIALVIITPAVVIPVIKNQHHSASSPSSSIPSSTPTNATQSLPSFSSTIGVEFSSTATTATTTSTPLPNNSTVPLPPAPTADGVYLVNGLNSSWLAYYYKISPGHDDGSQPNDTAIVDLSEHASWEGITRGTFVDTNITFTAEIVSNAQSSLWPINGEVGNATNGYRTFAVYKDDGRVLYKSEGEQYNTIYYAQ